MRVQDPATLTPRPDPSQPEGHSQTVPTLVVATRPAGVQPPWRSTADEQITGLLLERELADDDRQELLVRRSHHLLMRNRRDEAAAALLEVLEVLGDQPQDGAARKKHAEAMIELGYVHFTAGRSADASATLADAARSLSRAKAFVSHEEWLRMSCHLAQVAGCAAHNLEDNSTCLQEHLHSVEAARVLEDEPTEAMGLVNLADAYWARSDYGAAIQTYDDAVLAARRCVSLDALDIALIGRGIVLWSIGRFEEAATALGSGLALAQDLEYEWDRAYGVTYESNLLASINRLDQALQRNRQAVELASGHGSSFLSCLATAFLGWKSAAAAWPHQAHVDDEMRTSLRVARRSAEAEGYEGLLLLLRSADLLCDAVDSTVSPHHLEADVAALVDSIDRFGSLRGCWELWGLDLATALRARGASSSDLEDLIDEIIDVKESSLSETDRRTFRSTRRGLLRLH